MTNRYVIVRDEWDSDWYHIYELSGGKPWRRVFTIFVDDIIPFLGQNVFDNLDDPRDEVKFDSLGCVVIEN